MIMYISKNVFISIISGYLQLIKFVRPLSPYSKRKVLDNIYIINDFISNISDCDGISFLEKDS